jgi:hypothetical protein
MEQERQEDINNWKGRNKGLHQEQECRIGAAKKGYTYPRNTVSKTKKQPFFFKESH